MADESALRQASTDMHARAVKELSAFVNTNIHHTTANHPLPGIQEGIVGAEILSAIISALSTTADRVTTARAQHLLNLVSTTPTAIDVPLELAPEERALMFLSFEAFNGAEQALGRSLSLSIAGVAAHGRTGAATVISVAMVTGAASSSLVPFEHDGITTDEPAIQPLSAVELLFLLIRLRRMLHTEENVTLRVHQARPIIRRALTACNEHVPAIRLAFLCELAALSRLSERRELTDAELTEFGELVESLPALYAGIGQALLDGCDSAWRVPVCFKAAACTALARARVLAFDHEGALPFLKALPLPQERIACLIALRRTEEAALAIESELRRYVAPHPVHRSVQSPVGDIPPLSRAQAVEVADLLIKLAHLRQDPSIFDCAAGVFPSPKPYRLKGLLFFNQKNFTDAAAAFEAALAVAPNNEENLFSYGCTLVELEHFSRAAQIFKRILQDNRTHDAAARNLSYCYYKLDDVVRSLETLKSAAISDCTLLRQFLYLAAKGGHAESIRWALCRVVDGAATREAINYVLHMRFVTVEEAAALLRRNPHFDSAAVQCVLSPFGVVANDT